MRTLDGSNCPDQSNNRTMVTLFHLSFHLLYVLSRTAIVLGETADGGADSSIEIETKSMVPSGLELQLDDYNENRNHHRWGVAKDCPAGSIVTAYKFTTKSIHPKKSSKFIRNEKFEIPFLSSVLSGVALQCSKLGRWNNLVGDKVIFDGLVSVAQPWNLYKAQEKGTKGISRPVVGLTFWRSIISDGENVGQWQLNFLNERSTMSTLGLLNEDGNSVSEDVRSVYEEVYCPTSYVICGLTTQRHTMLGMITRLRFRCCYYCVPKEVNVVIYDFSNNGLSDVIHTIIKKIGLRASHTHQDGQSDLKLKKTSPSIGGSGSYGKGGNLEYSNTKYGQTARNPEEKDGGTLEKNTRESSGYSKGYANKNSLSRRARAKYEDDNSAEDDQLERRRKGAQSSSGGRTNSNFLLKARFEAKFGTSKSTAFNWEDTSSSLWSEDLDETDSFSCPALQRCTLTQLTGQCGIYQFNTPSFQLTATPLVFDYYTRRYVEHPITVPDPNPYNGVTGNHDLENRPGFSMSTLNRSPITDRPGEKWIILDNLLFAPSSGQWDEPILCPPGSFVTGQQLLFRHGFPLTGLSLQCSKLNGTDQFEPTAVISSGNGHRGRWWQPGSPAVGSSVVQYRLKGRRRRTNFELKFQGDNSNLRIPKAAQDLERQSRFCPHKYAICGFRTMYDREGRGQMTTVGFQCCYLCHAEEKTVVLESFTNLGYTDTIQTIRRLVGNNFSNTDAHDQTNTTTNALNMDGSTAIGLRAGFASKFGSTSHGGFKWTETTQSFWTQSEEKTLTILCKARHLCIYRQLIGSCRDSDIEIATPYTIKESFPLDEATAEKVQRKDEDDGMDGVEFQNMAPSQQQLEDVAPSAPSNSSPARIGDVNNDWAENFKNIGRGNVRNKEKEDGLWVTAGEKLTWFRRIRPTSRHGHGHLLGVSDRQERAKLCPPGSIVTAVKVLFQNESRALATGLSLRCSVRNALGQVRTALELTSGHGNNGTRWVTAGLGQSTSGAIVGFSFIKRTLAGGRGRGRTFEGLWQIIFDGGGPPKSLFRQSTQIEGEGSLTWDVHCVKDSYAICGIQLKTENGGQGLESGGWLRSKWHFGWAPPMNSMAFKCCHYCTPQEKIVTLDTFVNLDDSDSDEIIVNWYVGVRSIEEKVEEEENGISMEKVDNFETHGIKNDNRIKSPLKWQAKKNTPRIRDSSRENLETIFGQYFGNTSSIAMTQLNTDFSWSSTPRSLWVSLETKASRYKCGARRACRFSQLVGFCGDFEVATSLVIKQRTLLPQDS